MSREPRAADHELDAEGARARLEEAFPGPAPRDARYFAEGYDFRMFEVDSTAGDRTHGQSTPLMSRKQPDPIRDEAIAFIREHAR